MTPALNREALRKEAEVVVASGGASVTDRYGDSAVMDREHLGWALTVLSLLAELERVEQERDEVRKHHNSERSEYFAIAGRLEAAVGSLQDQLAEAQGE